MDLTGAHSFWIYFANAKLLYREIFQSESKLESGHSCPFQLASMQKNVQNSQSNADTPRHQKPAQERTQRRPWAVPVYQMIRLDEWLLI